MRNIIITLSFFAILIIPGNSISEILRFNSKGLDHNNTYVTSNSQGQDIFTLSDLSYEYSSSMMQTEIVLSFNYPAYKLVKDDIRKYNINRSSYCYIKNNNALGGGCAHFFMTDHSVEIDTDRNLWLGNSSDLGSFTIEFRLFPLSFKEESYLFSRIGYLSGEKNGIEIHFKENRISTKFYNIFKDSKGKRYNIFLNNGNPLEENRWHHFLLSYDRISGKLIQYINGDEIEVVHITENGKPFSRVLQPSFASEDLPRACIGKNYYGYLDEFRISFVPVDDLQNRMDIAYDKYKPVETINRIPINREGRITSPVYNFPSTGTSVTLFRWDEIIRENTFVWMEFRISDNLFQKNNKDIKWYRIENNQKNIYLKKNGNNYLRGKYFQWKAYLIPSPDGKFSPSIYNIGLSYKTDHPPRPPLFLEVSEIGDSFVRLRWKKNVEHDIGGYRIYYGVRSGRY
ncbi:MAG: LamG-like jellyroll fold domain-containing protein, partial [Spirochaetota bacterium]|nr:LamG-like jellyroll fold domain-containing protein [Spirochaetota bacterium]